MNLRRATSLAGAAQLLALLVGTFQYIRVFWILGWEQNLESLVLQPVWLLAQATLVLFLFVLSAELKRR